MESSACQQPHSGHGTAVLSYTATQKPLDRCTSSQNPYPTAGAPPAAAPASPTSTLRLRPRRLPPGAAARGASAGFLLLQGFANGAPGEPAGPMFHTLLAAGGRSGLGSMTSARQFMSAFSSPAAALDPGPDLEPFSAQLRRPLSSSAATRCDVASTGGSRGAAGSSAGEAPLRAAAAACGCRRGTDSGVRGGAAPGVPPSLVRAPACTIPPPPGQLYVANSSAPVLLDMVSTYQHCRVAAIGSIACRNGGVAHISAHMTCAGRSKRTAASRSQDGGAGVFRAERRPPDPMGPSPPVPGSCSPTGAGVLIAERASAARRARVDPGVPASDSMPH